ncbi:MAG: exodeoxyribonuclease VII small subunit [Armatimonadota bacterium]
MSEQTDARGFEEAVTRLETIVGALESGSLSLEESLAQFEQAVALSRYCAAQLDAAEQRISVLTEEGLQPGSSLPWLSQDQLAGAD